MGLAAATAYMNHACTGPPIGRIITPANENQFVYAKSLSKNTNNTNLHLRKSHTKKKQFFSVPA